MVLENGCGKKQYLLKFHQVLTQCGYKSTALTHWYVEYIQEIIHAVHALLYIVVINYKLIYPYPLGLLYTHCGNHMIDSKPVK